MVANWAYCGPRASIRADHADSTRTLDLVAGRQLAGGKARASGSATCGIDQPMADALGGCWAA